ncbi:MAG: TIGR01777 family protein [Acidobacteria bacterium]|nr:TIGR01777 family protein [Acidobacteriota bacterium]
MRVLVTGATGTIGRELCRRLLEQGNEVRVLTRRAGPSPIPGATAWQWNPLGELPPPEALAGVEAVVHLAGEPVAGGRWTPDLKQRIRDSRVVGTNNLVAAILREAVPPRVLVGASAVGFYGDRGEQPLDESCSRGAGFLCEVCHDWEEAYRPVETVGVRLALLRIGVVLSRSGGALERMLLPFRLGLGGRLGSGRQWFPWIHIDDILGLIELALFNDQISGVVNGVSRQPVTNEQFTVALARALRRPVFLPVPEFALRLLAGEMASVVLASQRVIPRAAMSAGYQFRFAEIDSALRDIVD